jgi:hypothetical protein
MCGSKNSFQRPRLESEDFDRPEDSKRSDRVATAAPTRFGGRETGHRAMFFHRQAAYKLLLGLWFRKSDVINSRDLGYRAAAPTAIPPRLV